MRSERAKFVVLGVVVLLSPLAILTLAPQSLPDKLVANLLQTLASLIGALYLWDAARTFAPDDGARKGWLLLAASMAANAIGFGIYGTLELMGADDPFPTIADAFWLISYPLALHGMLGLARLYRSTGLVSVSGRWARWIGAATLLLVCAFVFVPLYHDHDQAVLDRVILGLYPLFDAVLIGASLYMAELLRGFGRGAFAWPWVAIVAGFLVMAYTDAVYGVLNIHDLYHTGSIIDLGWIWSGLLLGLGGLLQRRIMTADVTAGRQQP